MKKTREAYYEFNRDADAAQLSFFRAGVCLPHFHHQMEILYVFNGSVTAVINDESRELSAGSLCVSDSYDVHSYCGFSENADAFVLIVPKNAFPEYNAMTKNRLLALAFCDIPEIKTDLGPVFRLLKNVSGKRGEMYRKSLAATVLSFIADVFPYKKSADADKSQGIRDILTFIYEQSDKDISLKSLSYRFGYTTTHFSRLFNSATGFHLREFINTLRVQRAAQRLKAGDSVLAASLDCGFSNTRTFHRAFTRLYGISPAKYSRNDIKAR